MPAIIEPVLGPLFQQAMLVDAGGKARQRLLMFLAASADAGEPSPSMKQITGHLGISPVKVDYLLDSLVAAHLIEVKWARKGRKPGSRGRRDSRGSRRNHYTLLVENWGTE